ncbi:MAG TPA: homoserine dehydrogenase, partial [Firmicutes bacterium]|nr:homoserine dehydrogenase [Bacillota bacterium]
PLPDGVLSDDVDGLLNDPNIDIVIELVGGTGFARTVVLTAIENGKHVVTANKALLATHGEEIFRAAREKGVDIAFEAAVGGSIPILKALRESLSTSRIDAVYGIVNGTTNYILTRMVNEGAPYDELLRSAQEQGFAERDPSADVKGWDSQQKLTILMRLAFGTVVRPDDILCEGIEQITPLDIDYAREFGYTIKLLAIAKRRGDKLEARVHPAMIPVKTLIADVQYEYNAIEVIGDEFGTQVFYGKGAGRRPTATVVVSDALDIAQRIQSGAPCSRVREIIDRKDAPTLVPSDTLSMRHYVRLEVTDHAGVLEDIAHVFASENISIESVIQKGRATADTVPLVIMTHEAEEAAVSRAVGQLEELDAVRPPVQRIRIEDLL